jgi:Secretion system C-terminal sorting domain
MKRLLLVFSLPLFFLTHLQTYAQAVNDICSGAITLTVGTTCTNTLVVKDGSVFNSSVPNPGCATYVGADLWYKLVMPTTGAVRIETDVSDGSITDGGMAVYIGADCNNLTLLECNNDGNINSIERFERITVQLPAGTTIYIRVWERNGVGAGSFNLCAFEFTIPPDATNDDCIDAIELTVATTCTPIVGTNYGATPSEVADATIPDPGCASYAGDDVWFKLTVPASGNLEVQTYEDDLFITDGGLAVYSGTCNPNGLTLLACNDEGGNISTTTPGFERIQLLDQTPGETLFVRFWSYNNNELGTFNICATEITLPPPATNDDCVDAIELTIGATCTPIIGTNSGATNSEDSDATIPDPGCYYSGGDVWFKVVVPASGNLEIETFEDDLSITDGGMAVYSGTCNSNGLTLLACDDDSGLISIYGFERIQLLNQTPGETLFVRVWSYNNVIGTFNICASESTPPPPPINDDCFDAIELPVVDSCVSANAYDGTNISATNSEDIDTTIPDPGCASYAGGDLWFKFVVPVSGNVLIETWGFLSDAITDGGLAIYTGACNPNGLTLLACDDNSNNNIYSPNFERIELIGQTPGDTLYIRFWAFNNAEVGTFSICVSKSTPVATNDDCIEAIDLIVDNSTPNLVTNYFASNSWNADQTIPDPSCYSPSRDVWFKVVVPPSGDLAVETYEHDLTITGAAITVYSGTCNPNGLTELACDVYSGIINSNFGRIELLGQTPGETLYIRVWSIISSETGTFYIFAEELNALSIPDLALDNFTMYPNPAKDLVSINFNEVLSENMSISIFDILGKLVLSKKSLDIVDEIALNISILKSGMYFVELRNGQQLAIKKLIVK